MLQTAGMMVNNLTLVSRASQVLPTQWLSSTLVKVQLMANLGDVTMTDMGVCACTGCEHQVSSEHAAISEGRTYCCTACAAGHPAGRECIHEGCACNELNRPRLGKR